MIHLALRRPNLQISSTLVCKRFYPAARLTQNSVLKSRGRLTNTNASGLMPHHSQSLKERPMKPQEGPIIKSIKEMYSCKWTDDSFSIYAKDAVFHHPTATARGREFIQTDFSILPLIFPRSEIFKFRILQNPNTAPPNTILIDQDVAYFSDNKSASPTKVVNSLLTLKLNDANKVVSHDEEWDHRKFPKNDDFLDMFTKVKVIMLSRLV